MENSLSNDLDMAVTMKNSVRVVDMNSDIFELGDFPDEIILKVCASLDLKDLLNCGRVAKRFRTISHDEFLWQRIDLCKQNVPAAFIQFILDRGCKYLDLSNSRILDFKSIQNSLNKRVQLTELNLENTRISEEESLFLVQNLTPKVKKINLGGLFNKDSDKHIKMLIKRCYKLEEIQLKHYDNPDCHITGSGITSIIEELKNTLETLDSCSCKKISYSKLVELLQRMTKLMNLNIRKSKYIKRLRLEPKLQDV